MHSDTFSRSSHMAPPVSRRLNSLWRCQSSQHFRRLAFVLPGPLALYSPSGRGGLEPRRALQSELEGTAEIENGSDSPWDISPWASGLSLQRFPGHPFIVCLHPAPCTTFSSTSLSFSWASPPVGPSRSQGESRMANLTLWAH